MNQQILFVIFNGFSLSNKKWKYKYFDYDNEPEEIDILDKLKLLGDIYFATPNFSNLEFYRFHKNAEKQLKFENMNRKYNFVSQNIDYTINDLKLNKICEKNYNEIKQLYPNHKLILIGHSFGGQIAIMFSRLYPDDCILNVLLDPAHYLPIDDLLILYRNKYNHAEISQISDDTISTKLTESLNIIKTYEKSLILNDSITQLQNFITAMFIREFITNYSTSIINVPTIIFRIYYDKQSEQYIIHNNMNERERNMLSFIQNLEYIQLKQSVYGNIYHLIWYNQRISDMIIKKITDKLHSNIHNKYYKLYQEYKKKYLRLKMQIK